MSWSKNQYRLTRETTQKNRLTFVIKWVLAVIAIVGVICGMFVLSSNDNIPVSDESTKMDTQINTAKPVKPKPITPANENKSALKGTKKLQRPDGEWRHGEGPRSIAVTNGCVVSYPHCPGIQLILPHPNFAAPFQNISDNELARLLSIKPGDDFIDAPLPRDFDKCFAQSLLCPIQIAEDESSEKSELKQKVKEARRILSDAMKRGESPREILIEEGNRFRKMMKIKDNYERIIREELANGASQQDIKDIAVAANQLLEKEGIESKVNLPYKIRLSLCQIDGTPKITKEERE